MLKADAEQNMKNHIFKTMNKLHISPQWISVKERLPEFNVSVLVFIPEEDNHITTGMWDVSKKWVLLDEYRVPKSDITYWQEMVDMPEDKSYTKSPVHNPAEDTITYQTRALQQQVFRFEYAIRNIDDYINSAIHPSSPVSRMIKSFIKAALPEPPEVAVLLPPVSQQHSIYCASYTTEALQKRGHIPGKCDCGQPEKVESQEELLDELIYNTFGANILGREEILKQFIITRKS